MYKTSINCAVFVLLFWTISSVTPQRVDFDADCDFHVDLYVIFSGNCTCRKADPGEEGIVQWYFMEGSLPPKVRDSLKGTLPQQIQDPEGMSSVLDVSPPYHHAGRITYMCALVTPSGELKIGKEHFIKFSYGPETAQMHLAETDGQWCPVVGMPTTVQCDVPAETVSPKPKFRAAFGPTEKANDDYAGEFIEDANLWRLTREYTPQEPGIHALSCYAMNTYFGPIIRTILTLEVYDRPPPPTLTIQKQNFEGRTDNRLVTEDGKVYGVACAAAASPGFHQTGVVISCGRPASVDGLTMVSLVDGEVCSCTAHYTYTTGCVFDATTEVVVVKDGGEDNGDD